MQRIEWTIDDLVFVPQLDADHQKVFQDLERVRQAVAHPAPPGQAGFPLWRFSKSFFAHLASEERLMRSSRYPALQWHERQHQAGRTKLVRLTEAIHGKNEQWSKEALLDLASWMRDHINLADRMFAAHLRNDLRERQAS